VAGDSQARDATLNAKGSDGTPAARGVGGPGPAAGRQADICWVMAAQAAMRRLVCWRWRCLASYCWKLCQCWRKRVSSSGGAGS